MLSIWKKKNMIKVQVDKNIFYFELRNIPNVDLLVITLYMWKCHNFETIFAFNGASNIQDAIGKGFGSR